MAEQLGDERETDDVVALQPREHLAGERPGRDPLEQWVAVDQERRLQRLEARDAELVPHARADPPQIEPAVAHHAHDARLRIGHVVSRCIEDDVDAELSGRDLLDLRGEVLGDRRVRVVARIARAEAEHDGRVRASRLVGARMPVIRRAADEDRRRDDRGEHHCAEPGRHRAAILLQMRERRIVAGHNVRAGRA